MNAIEAAKAQTTIIKFGDQDWRVTSFHCVVGPIISVDIDKPYSDSESMAARMNPLWSIYNAWHAASRAMGQPSWAGVLAPPGMECYIYPTDWRNWVAKWRKPDEFRPSGCRVLNYTNNSLIVNEMQLGEVSLAVVENGEVVLTNFIDLPAIHKAIEIYNLGEYWSNYAEGGIEHKLRSGNAWRRSAP
jgi:hypothetical protein